MIRPQNFPLGRPIIAILKLCVWSQDEEKIRRIWDDYLASEDRHLYLHFISGEPVGVIGLERNHGRPTVIRHLEHFKLNYSHSGQTNLWRRWP